MKKNTIPDPFIARVAPHVTTLLRGQRGKRPAPVGTALLVDVRGSYYVVSAAHVLEEGNKLWFFHDKREPRSVAGDGSLSRPIGQKMGPDRLDVGVLRLDHGAMPPYKLWQAVDIELLRPSQFPRKEIPLAFVGHPSSQVRVNPNEKQIKVKYAAVNGAELQPDSTYARLGLDPSSHLAFRLSRQQSKTATGSTYQFPDPHGLSGSPIWSQDELGACVVGIATEYHRAEGVMVATDIRHVIRLIEETESAYAAKQAKKLAV